MREAFPVDRIVEMARKLAEDAASEQVRLTALQLIAERAHGKVGDKLAITAGTPDDEGDDEYDELSVDDLRQVVELDRQRAAILAPHRVTHPMVVDGDVMLLPAPVAHEAP